MKYGRIFAMIYVDSVNLNAELLKKEYAEVLYIPPSECSILPDSDHLILMIGTFI